MSNTPELNIKNLVLEDVLGLSLDLATQDDGVPITVELCKTVQVKQYEPEVFMGKTTIYVPKTYTILERAVALELAHISVEFSIFTQLLLRKLVTQDEFSIRKAYMTTSIASLLAKLQQTSPNSQLLSYVFNV